MSSRLTPTRSFALGLLVALAAATAALSTAISRVAVHGPSMSPTLQSGDHLLVLRLTPRPGRLVVVRDPRQPSRILVKRCTAVGDGTVEVQGDNTAHSTDSRTFGVVPRRLMIGRPVYRYAPSVTAGWLWRA